MHPRYWYVSSKPNPSAKAGGQNNKTDLAKIPAKLLQYHTAIIAQSGAGKSVVLGRLIEELALRTTARFVVLDPNADFRRFAEAKPESLWTDAAYDPKEGGQLPHEASRDKFLEPWTKLLKLRVLTSPDPRDRAYPFEDLSISWPAVPVTALWADAPPSVSRLLLSDCHEVFRNVARLVSLRSLATLGKVDVAEVVKTAKELFRDRQSNSLLENQLNNLTSEIKPEEWEAVEAKWRPMVEDTVRYAPPSDQTGST